MTNFLWSSISALKSKVFKSFNFSVKSDNLVKSVKNFCEPCNLLRIRKFMFFVRYFWNIHFTKMFVQVEIFWKIFSKSLLKTCTNLESETYIWKIMPLLLWKIHFRVTFVVWPIISRLIFSFLAIACKDNKYKYLIRIEISNISLNKPAGSRY